MENRIIEAVTSAYLEACSFTDLGPDSDIPSESEFAPETIQKARSDCRAFIEQAGALGLEYIASGQTWDSFGHDIWFTRNGHGVGFWDRGLGDLGDKLTALSKGFGEVWSYQGDDGLIYIG
jgi:hypothetical protein